MKIWEYLEDSDNYQTLQKVNRADAKLFINNFDGKPFQPPWTPMSVAYSQKWKDRSFSKEEKLIWAKRKELPRGDFPSLTGTVPVFSDKAVQVLYPLIAKSVQILPLDCKEDKLYLVNVIAVVDCLDYQNAKVERFSHGPIMKIEHYEFKDEMLTSTHIFKLPEPKIPVYVSDEFRKVVEENGLKGLTWKPLS